MTVQITQARKEGDFVLVSSHSSELKHHGWNKATSNIPAAYLTGYLCGLRAKKAGISTVVLDMGLQRKIPGSRIFAALIGAVDAGLQIPLSEEILPSEDRRQGTHIGTKTLFTRVKKKIEEAEA
jgi:large subunit ribosomal protein L18